MATLFRPHMGVERVAQHIGAPDASEIDMADLSRGVDAGIGASGAAQADRPGVELASPRSMTSCTDRPLAWRCQPT